MKTSALAFASTSVLVSLLAACSAEVRTAPPAGPPPPPVDDLASARAAADTAFKNLRTRNFPLEGCDPNTVRMFADEHDAQVQANGHPVCTTFVVHRPNGQWAVIVRSGSASTNPQAQVVVAPNFAGVQKVVYAR